MDTYAYVCSYASRKCHSVELQKLYLMSDDDLSRTPLDPLKASILSPRDRVVMENEARLERVHVFATAGSKEALDTKLKELKEKKSRFAIPTRKSVGPLQFPMNSILQKEELKDTKASKAAETKAVKSSEMKRNARISKAHFLEKVGDRSKETKASETKAKRVSLGHPKFSSTPKKSTPSKTPVPTKISAPTKTPVKVHFTSSGTQTDRFTSDAVTQTEVSTNSTEKKLQMLCDALLEKQTLVSKKICKIKDMKSAVTEEGTVEIPDDKVYVGNNKFVDKTALAKIDKLKSYKARMEALLPFVFDEEPRMYSLGGKGHRVTDNNLESIHNLMSAFNWKNIMLHPMKIGNHSYEALSYEYNKRRLSKYLSSLQAREDNDSTKKRQKLDKNIQKEKKELKKANKKKENEEVDDDADFSIVSENKEEEDKGDSQKSTIKEDEKMKAYEEDTDKEDDDDFAPRKKRRVQRFLEDSLTHDEDQNMSSVSIM